MKQEANDHFVEQKYVATDKELKEIEKIEDENNELVLLKESQYSNVKELAEFLPEEVRNEWKLPKKALLKLSRRLNHIKHGGTVEIPMMCTGPSCPMANSCPLLEENVAPIGKPCPIEKYLVETLRAYYIKDLQVNKDNFVHMTQVNDLVECEVLDNRMTGYLAKEGWFEDVTVAVDNHGEPILRREEAIPYRIKMSMKGRKDKLLRNFLATREMQAKYNLQNRSDPSSYAADLLQRGEELKQAEDAEIVEEDD